MTFGCWLWKRHLGDLELLQAGFRFVPSHGKLMEDAGLGELFSSFTRSPHWAQVYCSEIVKMPRKGEWAGFSCAWLRWLLLVWTKIASQVSDAGGSPCPEGAGQCPQYTLTPDSSSSEAGLAVPASVPSLVTGVPSHTSISVCYRHLLLSHTASLPPGSTVDLK